MRRLWTIFKAKVHAFLYLLCQGLVTGECEMVAYNHQNRIILIVAMTGSLLKDTVKVTKIFYKE